jgi:hypothetical protein
MNVSAFPLRLEVDWFPVAKEQDFAETLASHM